MPPKIDAKDAEKAIIILNRCISIESELTRKFGAHGNGISEKAEYCEHLFAPGFLSRIRFIASVRNKLSHQAEISLSIKEYIRACDLIDQAIAEVPSSVETQDEFAEADFAANQGLQSASGQTQAAPPPEVPQWLLQLFLLAILLGLFLGGKWVWQKVTAPGSSAMVSSTSSDDDKFGVANPLPSGSRTSIPFASHLVTAPSAIPLNRFYEHVWGVGRTDDKPAETDWRKRQAVFDGAHADVVSALPNETFWAIDKSSAAQMKELRRPTGRVLQLPLVLSGMSGLKATLDIPLTKPVKGKRDWQVFRFDGMLTFENGKRVPMEGVQFFNVPFDAAPVISEMRDVFSCSKSDTDGCAAWVLNSQVNAVGLSRRGIEYARYIR